MHEVLTFQVMMRRIVLEIARCFAFEEGSCRTSSESTLVVSVSRLVAIVRVRFRAEKNFYF